MIGAASFLFTREEANRGKVTLKVKIVVVKVVASCPIKGLKARYNYYIRKKRGERERGKTEAEPFLK